MNLFLTWEHNRYINYANTLSNSKQGAIIEISKYAAIVVTAVSI